MAHYITPLHIVGCLLFISWTEWNLKIKNEWVKEMWKMWLEIRNKLNLSHSKSKATKGTIIPEIFKSITEAEVALRSGTAGLV